MNAATSNGVEEFLNNAIEGIETPDGTSWRTESDGDVTAYAYLEDGTQSPPLSIDAEREPDGSLFVGINAVGGSGFHEPTNHGGVFRDDESAAEALAEGAAEVLEG